MNSIQNIDPLELAIAQDMDQRTADWHSIRLGKFTSSEIHKLMGTLRSTSAKLLGLTDGGITYVEAKVAEIITGERKESPQTFAIMWGNENEPMARERFITDTGIEVLETGFHLYGDHAGGSPDGITAHGIIEIKCPFDSGNHVRYLTLQTPLAIKEEVPEYYWQMVANMVFTGTEICHFISYDPRVKHKQLQLHVVEVPLIAEEKEQLLERIDKAVNYKNSILKTLNL